MGRGMGGEIKKGPWKAEEDEVLMNHVKKYGPKDWSSIRSKGLLHRTGKSCRLRWVNKLRPNLKNGVKFSAEEERIVIELQGEFGNKWARIATYLPGRTDNDVKNFWSSRQKRLTRILQTPTAPSPPKSQKNNRGALVLHDAPTVEAPKFSSSTGEESSSKNQSFSSTYIVHSAKPFKMVPLPELVNPNLCHCEQNLFHIEFNANEKKSCQDHQPNPQLSFPQITPLQTELPLALESQELMTRLGEPNFFEVFANDSGSDVGNPQLHYAPAPHFGTGTSCGNGGKKENDNPSTLDSFIDDFPMDLFDHIEPLPSPSEW